MFLKKILPTVFLAAALISCASASASTLNWTLSGLTFEDGGLGSGTFVTDSITGKLVSYDITTTAGSQMSGHHYTQDTSFKAENGFGINSFTIPAMVSGSVQMLTLEFHNALTFGGTNSLVIGRSFPVGSSWELPGFGAGRYVTAGIASAVPEPEIYSMLLAGVCLAGTIARRRKKMADAI